MVAITAAFVTQPVFGVPDHQLIFTETSSTDLTVTYDGSPLTVTRDSSDLWHFSLPSGFFSFGQPQWTEPDKSNLVNYVDFTSNTEAIVHSDILPNSVFSTNADDTSVEVGTIFVGGVPVDATFDDDAATAETPAVPDTGTTGSLLGLSLIGLVFLRRKLCC